MLERGLCKHFMLAMEDKWAFLFVDLELDLEELPDFLNYILDTGDEEFEDCGGVFEGDLGVFKVEDFEFVGGLFFDFPFDLIFSEVGGIKEDTFPWVIEIDVDFLFFQLFAKLLWVFYFVPKDAIIGKIYF